MIKDQESFEAALQRVADLLEHPPADGSQEDQEFLQLLHDIELFHPTALSAPPRHQLRQARPRRPGADGAGERLPGQARGAREAGKVDDVPGGRRGHRPHHRGLDSA